MTLHRMLFVCLFALAGCFQSASDSAPVATPDDVEELSLSTAERPGCPALVCNPDRTCPVCNGQAPACSADNNCIYSPPPTPPTPPPVPLCPAAACWSDWDCVNVCREATNPRCSGGFCRYFSDPNLPEES